MVIQTTRGERFKDARKRLPKGKNTMKAVKEATGINQSTISALEDDDDTRDVGYSIIVKLAQHYGVSVDYLLGLSDISTVKGNEQTASSLGLPEEFINYLMFTKENNGADYPVLCRFLSCIELTDAMNSIALLQMFYSSDFEADLPPSARDNLEALRKEVQTLTKGAHSIVHSGLVCKSLMYEAQQCLNDALTKCAIEILGNDAELYLK